MARSPSDIKEMLLEWTKAKTRNYKNVEITNFSSSWSDGLAFCALIHNYFPGSFEYDSLEAKNRRFNFNLAFRVAEEEAGVSPLLDVDDMVMMKNKPDWKCVFTYVQSLYRTGQDSTPQDTTPTLPLARQDSKTAAAAQQDSKDSSKD